MTDSFSFSEEKFLLVGKIGKPHGLKGEVKLQAYSNDPATMLDYQEVVLIDAKGILSSPLRIEKSRFQGKTIVFKLVGIDDRNGSESLTGMGILLNKKNLPETEDDEYFWYQFYDLPVSTESGKKIGIIQSIFSNGAHDIMIVKDGKKEYLIPILVTIIKEHTKDGVVITPPPGLLEMNTGNDE